jgi:hypothetical protein
MNQVKDEWDTFMFHQAHNWEVQRLSEEVKKKLSSNYEDGEAVCKRSWFNMLNLGDVSEL